MKKNILILLIYFFISNFCFAAKFTFHDGSTLDAKIIDISDEKLILEYNDNTIERSRHEIASISNIETSEQTLLNQIEEKRSNYLNIQKSAYETLSLLKEKLKVNCEEEKRKIIEDFNKEKIFLEKNLELLAIKHASLSQDFENTKLKLLSSNRQLIDLKNQNEQFSEKILKLKNNINNLNEEKLKSEVVISEKVQESIKENKKLMENEKSTIIETYEAQIVELQKQLNESNLKALKFVKENATLSEKLANSEKLSDQNANALLTMEKEYDNYKININNEMSKIKEDAKQDYLTLEKLLKQSADNISDKNNEIKMLNEKLNFKEDELSNANNEIEILKKEIQSLEKIQEKLKQESIIAIQNQKNIKEEIEANHQKILKSLIDKVLLEDSFKINDYKNSNDIKSLETFNTDLTKEGESRLSLIKIFQDDINKISKELDESKNELLKLKNENQILKSDIMKSELAMKEIEYKKQNAENKTILLQQEKENMKKEVDDIIAGIKEESKKELEAVKAELKNENSSYNVQQKEETQIEKIETKITNNEIITPDEIKELPFYDFEKEDNTVTNNQNEQKVIIEVGTISQIEEAFSRIFIDTIETLKENDKVYVKNNEKELLFTIIHIYDAIDGALAESSSQNNFQNLKLGDKVYIK